MASMTAVRISLPLIPGYNDSEKNLSETAKFALSLGVDHIDINPLHRLGTDKYTCLGLTSPYETIGAPRSRTCSKPGISSRDTA